MKPTPVRQVAMADPRPFEDFRLRSSDPARVREVGVVGTAYDSIICRDLTYVSTPITSGAALYAAMDAAGVATPEELKRDPDFFHANVIQPNLTSAAAVAEAIADAGGAVIAPAAFEAHTLGWSQDEYMGLWLDVIERKATRIAMVDGWEYSNGGAEEYLQALLMQADRRDRTDIEIVDARGVPIPHDRAISLLSDAVSSLAERGFRPLPIARVLHRAVVLHGMVADESDYGHLSDTCGRTSFRIGSHYLAALPSRELMRERIERSSAALATARSMIQPSELGTTSSTGLAPGIVRSSGRGDLERAPAAHNIGPDLTVGDHSSEGSPQ